jgi:hypothetical protein
VSGGVLVGGAPAALLAASSALHEVAYRTDDVGRALAAALAPATTTVLATVPFAPLRGRDVLQALAEVTVSPLAGLASVAAAYEKASLQMRLTGQALEAAGAVGLLATGGLGLLRGQRPTVLASADGLDLHRQSFTSGWSLGDVGGASSLAVREVRRPDGTTFFVVELTTEPRYAASLGVQVNGVGGYVEGAGGAGITLRWAVPTRRDAELLVAAASAALLPGVGARFRDVLPRPTESVLAVTGSATVVGGIAGLPGSSSSGSVTFRDEVTVLASGGQRFAASISGAGQVALLGMAGTAGAGSVRLAVERSPNGAVTQVSLSTAREVERGRHGDPLLEAGNREATLVEHEIDVELTPARRAAADRVAVAVAGGHAPAPADLDELAGGAVGAETHTYDVRHQLSSADVALGEIGVGGSGAVDTADLRQP